MDYQKTYDILMQMGFVYKSHKFEQDGWKLYLAENKDWNSIEVSFWDYVGWFTVYFPHYLCFETRPNYAKDGMVEILKYAHMKTIEDVITLLSKAPYKNQEIKNNLLKGLRPIKIKNLNL